MRTDHDPAERLREHGLQVTAQRMAVLRAVWARPHGTAVDVAAYVRDQIGSISRQAVYDALAALIEKGVIRRLQPAGSAALFDPRAGDDHQHVVCRRCLAVVDVDCAVGPTTLSNAAGNTGFAIDEAEIVFWGTCPRCRAATANEQQD